MLAEHDWRDSMQNMNLAVLDPKQLQAFAAVMSAGSITGAARLLGHSQPAVTRLIQDLEVSLGFALLHRSGPRISPTAQGILFHEEVERLLVGLKHASDRAAAIATGELRAIEIAAIPALSTGLVPRALAKLDPALLPRQIHLRSTSAEQVVQSVLSQTSDFGVASLPIEHPGLEVHWIAEAPCVAALASDDPLAKRNVVRLADLADRRLVTMANPYRLRGRVDDALARAGISPVSIIDTNASLTAIAAARAGLGVAIIEPATAYAMPLEGLVVRPLDVDIPFLFGAISPVARPLSATISALSAALQEVAKKMLPRFRLHDPARRDNLADAVYGRPAGGKAAKPSKSRKTAR